jgi:histidinol-phosphate aminotransferase
MYAIEAGIHDTDMIKIPRLGDDFNHLDIEKIVTHAQNSDNHVKMIFICNPGNPSSTSIPPHEVEQIIQSTQENCMVVVDEAYIDFASHASFVELVQQYPNLIILRTVSKGYGLAGLRCGTIIANSETIAFLKRLTAAYPVPQSTEICGVAALSTEGIAYMQDKQRLIKQERSRLLSALSSIPAIQRIFPSDANFLCLQVRDAAQCVIHFANHGIVIRNRSAAIPNTVNIAIGTAEQNDKVINALKTLT